MYSVFTGRGPENDALGLKSEWDTGKKLVPNFCNGRIVKLCQAIGVIAVRKEEVKSLDSTDACGVLTVLSSFTVLAGYAENACVAVNVSSRFRLCKLPAKPKPPNAKTE